MYRFGEDVNNHTLGRLIRELNALSTMLFMKPRDEDPVRARQMPPIRTPTNHRDKQHALLTTCDRNARGAKDLIRE